MYYAISGDNGFQILRSDTNEIVIDVFQENCSFLCPIDNCPIGDCIFAITETAKPSTLCLYTLDYQNKCAEKIGAVLIDGGALCHLSYSKKHKILFGACYEDGVLFSMPFSPDNPVFNEITYYKQEKPTDADLTRAHCGVLSQSENLLFSANIALDRIYSYKISDSKMSECGFLQLPIGLGPRHILPIDDTSYYVITEYSNEILLIKDSSLFARYSTISGKFKGESFGASLAFDRENMRLYASNRGENSIAVFAVLDDFTLTFLRRFPCGNWPRHIALLNNDKSLLAVAASRDDKVMFYDTKSDNKLFEISLKSASYII